MHGGQSSSFSPTKYEEGEDELEEEEREDEQGTASAATEPATGLAGDAALAV